MSFLIAFFMAGSYWQGNVFCKTKNNCTVAYSIAPPKAMGTVAPSCENFKVLSQTALMDKKAVLNLTCTLSKNPHNPSHSFAIVSAEVK